MKSDAARLQVEERVRRRRAPRGRRPWRRSGGAASGRRTASQPSNSVLRRPSAARLREERRAEADETARRDAELHARAPEAEVDHLDHLTAALAEALR